MSNAPVTLQAICPMVRGFTQRQNCLQGCLVSSVIWCLHRTTCWTNCPFPSHYHVRFVCQVVTQWRTVQLPPLTLCCHVTPKDDRVTTLHTPWTAASVTVARNSSVHAHIRMRRPMVPNSEAEVLNFLKLP